MKKKIIIVGGVAGGASAAARLRRLDEDAEIVLLEKGAYISFANCGLPYYIGGEIKEKSALTLQTPKSFRARFNVDVRIQNEAVVINREAKELTIKDLAAGTTYTEHYDTLILSMGADPVKPPVPGMDAAGAYEKSRRVFTLRNIPDTYKIKDFIETEKPKNVLVVGGGYIGVEMAENLLAAGLEVTIVEMLDQVIAPIDYDMACEVHQHIRSKGVTLRLKTAVTAIREEAAGLKVGVKNGEGEEEIYADMLIMAVGVRPESGIAAAAGLAVNQRGAVIVDEHMRTSDENIYAVGDAVEVADFVSGQKTVVPLAGPANKQGRIAADNICGIGSVYGGTQGSAILKVFDLTVACTGINEKTAKRLGLSYGKSFTYSASHAGYYPGAVNMSVKIIFEKQSGKILGAQITGYEGVDKRCDVIAAVIRFGGTAADLAKLELCYAPPYSSAKDPVNMAGFVIENAISGRVKPFHWHDVENLPQDGSAILLDTRTAMEFANGSIKGFINIPLDELRDRLIELDKTKKVYVACQIGLRGYAACRILSQKGFDCYNLSGGYRLYQSIFANERQKTGDNKQKPLTLNTETQLPENAGPGKRIALDACGLSCPGPIVKLGEALKEAAVGDTIEISTTDPAFAGDIEGFCRRTGHIFGGISGGKGINIARITKAAPRETGHVGFSARGSNKNFIVFSGDLDRAIASFVMANAAAAMGRKTAMFFTFWGLNILRRRDRARVKKDLVSRMFGGMMPRGSEKLGLSKMNMGGLGAKMIRAVMKNKNVDSLEALIKSAQDNGVELIACAMSMDVMGITPEELIPGVKTGGAASMLAFAEESDMSLFI